MLARGKRAFVIRYGVIGWGIPTALLWTLFMAWWNDDASPWLLLGIALVLFPLGGIWFGRWMWKQLGGDAG